MFTDFRSLWLPEHLDKMPPDDAEAALRANYERIRDSAREIDPEVNVEIMCHLRNSYNVVTGEIPPSNINYRQFFLVLTKTDKQYMMIPIIAKYSFGDPLHGG